MHFGGPIVATPHLGDQISQTPIFGALSGPRRLQIYRRCRGLQINLGYLSIYLRLAVLVCHTAIYEMWWRTAGLVDEAMEVSGKVVEVGDKDVVGSVVGDDRADDRLVYL